MAECRRVRRHRTALVSLAILLVLPWALTGCTAGEAGLTGVSVGVDGHLVIEMAGCGKYRPAVAVVMHRSNQTPDTDNPDSNLVDDLRFEATGRQDSAVSLDTSVPPGAWRPVKGGTDLDATVAYVAMWRPSDTSYAAAAVGFSLGEIAALRVGDVRYAKLDEHGEYQPVVTSRADFLSAAAAMC